MYYYAHARDPFDQSETPFYVKLFDRTNPGWFLDMARFATWEQAVGWINNAPPAEDMFRQEMAVFSSVPEAVDDGVEEL